jgi:choline dehydrogenase-like flavoprotein
LNALQQVHSGGKALDFPRGKGLGGSSAINFETYARGQIVDYDDWAQLGNSEWDFKGLLPYFKKHEHFDGSG